MRALGDEQPGLAHPVGLELLDHDLVEERAEDIGHRRDDTRGYCQRLSMSHPFLPDQPPVAIAHRGGAEEAPENTLEAFAAAVELGFRYLETDAHVTRDGVVVAFHDDHLDNVTDSAGAIADLSLEEVEAADAGAKFTTDGGRTFPFRGRGLRVPRLEELLLRWPDARVNIDPKADTSVAPLVALLDRLGAWDRVCIGAFSDRRIRQVREHTHGRACTSMGPAATATARLAALTGRMPRPGRPLPPGPDPVGRTPIVTARLRPCRASRAACTCTCGRSTIRRRCTSCSTSASTAS